ncbi:MAG: zf-HC2 domain-containing protein [Synergistaceae bacterium]|jgi:hypothetical protein|nr:zf-HC2 domain-containing protein [Synergistaceae bacterium]
MRVEEGIIDCGDCELLISKSCDGECTSEEIVLLGSHLRECGDCRVKMDEYREISSRISSHILELSCPPPPELPARETGLLRRIAGGGSLMRYAAVLGGVAAGFLFFFSGHFAGYYQAQSKVVRNLSPVAVTTPSLWAADRPSNPLLTANLESEQPFTDGIGRYRSAIAEELRRDNVDWMKVRELVESMGELRTDLELLTIHMAYIDIRSGSSPTSVANHWEAIGSMKERTVLKP